MITAFSAGLYDFRPITHDDITMISVWLHEPHVREWWGNPRAERNLIRSGIDQPGTEGLVVSLNFVPFAYVQIWEPQLLSLFNDQPPGTRAIDTFIGVPDMVGKGHGSAIVSAVAGRLLDSGAPRVIIDPDPDNLRAIKAYKRAGFVSLGERSAADGSIELMARDRP